MSVVYIGNYDQAGLKEKRLRKFKELCKISGKSQQLQMGSHFSCNKEDDWAKKTLTAESNLNQQDPTMKRLNEILKRITKLEKEAIGYNSDHINQDYRRINTECAEVQMELDGLTDAVSTNEEARKIKKFGILKAERAAQLISKKIHSSPPLECKQCLRLC